MNRNTSFKPSKATPCILCEKALDHFTNNRKIPDYLCSTCYRQWGPGGKDQLDAPWMKYLMNQERYRRMKRQRRIKAGTSSEEISLDELADAGYTVPHTILRDNYDRPRPRRRGELHSM